MGEPMTCCVVLPAFNEAEQIEAVIESIPNWVCSVVVVDDGSTDDTAERVRCIADSRVLLLCHEKNQGIGAAMKTGYRAGLLAGHRILVKMDADGQMDPDDLVRLVGPLELGLAEYVKGNRFRQNGRPAGMPAARWFGNVALSFLNKIATGYWHVFDPQCGYTAISASALQLIDYDAASSDYFFENDMLARLNVIGARVVDVSTASKYGDETSKLLIRQVIVSFPLRLLQRFWWRVVRRHLVWDFGAIGALSLAGLLLLAFGVVFGSYHWWESIATRVPATTGTVMLAVLPIVVAIQMLLQALILEVGDSPGAEETRVYGRMIAGGWPECEGPESYASKAHSRNRCGGVEKGRPTTSTDR